MAASAGTVTLNLDANSVKMIRELQKAQRQTKRSAGKMRSDMARAFKSMAKSAAVFGVAMAAAAAAAAKFSISMADNIGKSADALGLGIEEFQEYEFAAGRAGIATSQFTSNMTAFVKRVGEAKAGMGPLVSGLKNLNPTLLENLKNAKNQGEALRLMADAVKNADSATERAALTNAAFSRAGVTMVNMLDDGAAGLNKVAREARDLGVVMQEDLVRKAEEATDKMGDLQKVLQIRIAETVLENADAIIKLSNAMIVFVTEAPGFLLFLKDEFNAVLGFIDNADFVRLSDKLVSLKEDLAKMTDPGFIGIMGRIFTPNDEEQIAAIREEIRTTQNLLDEIEAKASDRAQQPTGETGTTAPTLLNPDGVQADADKVSQIIANMMDKVKTFGMTDDQKALINIIKLGAGEEAQREFIKATQALRGLIEAEEIANAVLEEVVVTAERLPDVVVEGATAMDEFALQAARNMQDAFADFLFDPFDEGVKGMAESFAKTIQRMAADAAAQAILNAIFGGLAGSSNAGIAAFGASFGGGRASGGDVLGGTAYLVGEDGPEVIIPRGAGTVIPNGQIGGSNVVVNIDARESDNPGRLLALVPVIQAQVEASISLKTRRGYM